MATLASAALVALAQPTGAPPATEKRPTAHEYHGVRVMDDYEWLENWSDPAVQGWTKAQNEYARAYLDSRPDAEAIRKRVTAIESAEATDYFSLTYRKGTLFGMKRQPPKQQPMLVVMDWPLKAGSEHVLLDPVSLDEKGTTTIDFFEASRDGAYLAVSLSKGGSESGDVSFYETKTGKRLSDEVPRVNGGTAGGSVAWNADGSGIYYTRYPRGDERPAEDMGFYQQVYFHKLGTPTDQDIYQIGKDFPRIAEIALETSADGQYVLASVQNGDGGEYAHYVLNTAAKQAEGLPDVPAPGAWLQITQFLDQVTRAKVVDGGAMYVLSRKGAPRGRIQMFPLSIADLASAATLVDQSEATIESFEITESHIYVVDQAGGPEQVRDFNALGKELDPLPLLPISAVGGLCKLPGDDILYRNESFVSPAGWYHYNPTERRAVKTTLGSPPPIDFAGIEVVREMAKSKDGTPIPLNILRPKGAKLDGSTPTLLYGYGGYGVSLTPGFRPRNKIWLEQGCVYAIANLRGGGEFGEAWHLSGNLTSKQNVFDDFLACAQHLIDAKYATPDKLAIMGGSNGGLLMGAALTQRPELFRAVVSSVGIYDMLRVELSPNGAFNVTEFGTVKNADQFKALYAYSPLHRVKAATAYPAVLMFTGVNDPRVEPWHSRKMTAALQAASTSDRPILLRTDANAGHGIGSSLSQRIEQEVDMFAFLFDQLGVKYKAVE